MDMRKRGGIRCTSAYPHVAGIAVDDVIALKAPAISGCCRTFPPGTAVIVPKTVGGAVVHQQSFGWRRNGIALDSGQPRNQQPFTIAAYIKDRTAVGTIGANPDTLRVRITATEQ